MEITNSKGVVTKIFTNNIEESAIQQIQRLCNSEPYQDCTIRVMPDVHAGKGCTIGTVIQLKDRVTPSLVGIDIGCGVFTLFLGKIKKNFTKLDKVISSSIAVGSDIYDEPLVKFNFYKSFKKKFTLDEIDYYNRSIGSLGGGNHFIEVDEDESGNCYLLIHTGSRRLGYDVCTYYQNLALSQNNNSQKDEIINRLKSEGREKEIQSELQKLTPPDREFPILEGELFKLYINDIYWCQKYAMLNRQTLAFRIIEAMDWKVDKVITTEHNYIDFNDLTLRKGAVSAKLDESLVIPLNMKDGSLLCIGKGNEDWLCSAPHGAGRRMSRSKAKSSITLESYQYLMKNVYSTTVSKDTLDEAPQAYKPAKHIIEEIQDTVEIVSYLKSVYNYKASE